MEVRIPRRGALERPRDDGAALARTLAQLRPAVIRYCRARIGGDPAIADDIAAGICADLLAALPHRRDTGAEFAAFAYPVAAAAVTEFLRGRALGHGPLDGLTARQREILVLRVAVGLTAEQTAAALGTTAAAIRVAQHRALAALRTVLPAA